MAFGERVGSAYVKLHADGDDVPDDIERSLKRLDPVMKAAATRHSDAYSEAFDKQMKENSPKTRNGLYRNLQEGLGKMHAIGEELGTDFFDGLQLQLTRELGDSDLGKLIRDKLEDDFALTGSYDRLGNSLKDINRIAIQSQIELDGVNDEAEKVARTLDEKLEKELRDVTRETDQMVTKTRIAMEDYNKSILKGNDALRRSLVDQGKGWLDIDAKMRAHAEATAHVDTAYKRFNKTLDDHADKTARVFGKGARNDFINLVGVMVGGITRMMFLLPKLGSSLLGAFKGEGQLDILKIVGNLSTAVIGVVIGISALVLVAGPVAALTSGIAAAVTALVASLTFAAGALGGVALGLGGVLVPAIGIAVLALTHLDDETKLVAKSVGDEFGKLGDKAGEAIGPGLQRALKIVKPEIAGLTPLIEDVSEALGNVAVGFAQITKGTPYQSFVGALTQFLPTAIESLGESVGNITEGFMGMFRAVRPLMTRFLDWFEDVTARFSDWANSPKGQTELLNFFEKAGDSAAIVGDTIGDISDAIGKLISSGKDTGDSLLKELGDQAEKLGDYLDKHPDAVEKWFGNGKDVAEDIGNLLLDIVELIDDFDTEEARDELETLFHAIEDVLELLGDLVDVWEFLWNNRIISLDIVLDSDSSMGERILALIPGAMIAKSIGTAIGHGFSSAAQEAAGWFRGLGNRITRAIDSVNWDRIIVNPVNRVHGWFRGLGGRITNRIGNVDWGRIISSPVNRVIGWFAGLAGRIANRAGDVDWGRIIQNPTARVIGWFAGLAGDIARRAGDVDWGSIIPNPVEEIVGWFSGLGARITSAIGSVSIDIDIPDPTPGYDIPGIPWAASGMVVAHPTLVGVGEAGREAIVPLDRPLHQVDPAVRDLAAFAQGQRRGVTVEAGAIVVTGVSDPKAAADWMLNEFVQRVS